MNHSWGPCLLVGLALACTPAAPVDSASDPAPTDTASTLPTTTTTTTTTTPGIQCADPSLRGERAFDRFEDGGVWSNLGGPDTHLDLLPGSGIAVADLDGDADLDVFLPNDDGSRLLLSGPTGFSDATATHLPADALDHAVGVTAVDVDADADLDLYLSRQLAPDRLLLNDGSGRFVVDPTWDPPPLRGAASTFADIDGDGDLDAFLARYGVETIAGTDDPNVLLINEQGTLSEVALPPTLADGHTLVPGLLDLDGDRDPDLWAINDFGWILPNAFAWNDQGSFTIDAGTGLSFATNGMGLGVADLNDDEIPDLAVTGWNEYTVLLSQGNGLWADAAFALGIRRTSQLEQEIPWAAEFADLDNDGDEDLYVARGYAHGVGIDAAYPELLQPDAIFVNDGGLFTDQAEAWGHDESGVGRGAVLADLNDDGWLDLVVRDKLGGPRLYLARCGDGGWLRIQLSQDGLNPFAIGAVVRVMSDSDQWIRWVHAGGTGFASSAPAEVHVGLGAHERVDIEVTWPDGATSLESAVAANRIVQIRRD